MNIVQKFPRIKALERQWAVYWVVFGAGVLWTGYLWLNSPGTPVQDEIGHYLLSRHAWQDPELVLDTWGRVMNTLVYMIPALGGLDGARLFSIVMAGLTVFYTTKVAQKIGGQLIWLPPLFLWFQPWFHDLSYAVITQVPFSLLMILGCYFWLSQREPAASVAFGLLPLVRHEGIALMGLWWLYVLYRRKWSWGLISSIPSIIYNIISFAALGSWPYAIFFDPQPTEYYGSGHLLHYLLPVILRVGLPVVILSLYGMVRIIRLGKKALFLVGYLFYFVLHSVIFYKGLYASGGYDFFLLPIAPGFAIAATLGAEFILALLVHGYQKSYHSAKQAAIQRFRAIILAIFVIPTVYLGLQTQPRPMDAEGVALQQAADWLNAQELSPPRVISSHVWFLYFYPQAWDVGITWTNLPQLNDLEAESVAVWDKHYAERTGLSRNVLDHAEDWRLLHLFGDNCVRLYLKASAQP